MTLNKERGRPNLPELSPNPGIVDLLHGRVSDPVTTISHKPGSEGQIVTVRLALEGPCLLGLTDWRDNREWSGIFEHCILSGRYSDYFGKGMERAGHRVDRQRNIDTMPISHSYRRPWEEAGWYPEVAPNAAETRSVTNEILGIQFIKDKVPKGVFDLVVALGLSVEDFLVDPSICDTWDYKLTTYADHRTTVRYEPLNTRLGDFLLRNFYPAGTVTPELKDSVYLAMKDIIEREKNFRLGKEGAEEVSLPEADGIVENLGAGTDSERLTRKDLMSLVLQDADTEAALIKAGVDPDGVNDETVPMPAWEHNLRTQYIQAAEDDIVARVQEIAFTHPKDAREIFESDFSTETWWGRYARGIIKIRIPDFVFATLFPLQQ